MSSVLLLFWIILAVPAHASPDTAGEGVKDVPAEAASVAVSEAVPAAAANEVPPSGEDVFAEPSPVRGMPEQVTLRAEYQPAPVEPPMLEEVAEADASQVALLPVLTMLAEDDGLTFEEAVSRFSEFQPFDRTALLREGGALWMHLALDNVAHSAPGTLWLDLGDQLPPGVEVWLSSDGLRWRKMAAETEGVYPLAHAGDDGQALIRLDGMPGLWFSPVLRPLALVMQSPERAVYDFSLAVLSLLSAVCFFLCLGLRGESRFWTFLLASAAAVQAVWAVPPTASGIGAAALPGVFAAGVALLMLPHIGRVLMRTRITSPFADVFFMVLALLGVCAALLPLVPGFSWVAHLLVLWPLVAVLCFPPALVLLLRGVQGSLPFSMACLFMGGGALIALSGLPRGMEAPLWGSCVFFGPVFGLLCLISASPTRLPKAEEKAGEGAPEQDDAEKDSRLEAMRESVRGAVEELLDEACRLDQTLNKVGADARHADIMARADGMAAIARRLSEKVLDAPAPAELPEAGEVDFDLRQIIRSVFASVASEAENKGLGLSWYVAPHLGRRYRGDKARLTALLSLLLSDSVRASSGGAVSLRVRRADSTHPGRLLFSVADTGEALPPHGRSSSLLARTWELASANGGELLVNSGPQGTELGFSLECAAYEEDGTAEKSVPGEADAEDSSRARRGAGKLIIVASSEGVGRQMLAHYLSGMGFRIWEARSAAEAAVLYESEPAALMVFDGVLAEDDMAHALASVRMYEGEHSLKAAPFLLLSRDALQAERMGKAGCDESLLPPLMRKDLRAMARWLTAPEGSIPRPVLSSQRVTLADVLAGASAGNLRFQRKDRLKPFRAEPAAAAPEKAAVEQAPVSPAGAVQPEPPHGREAVPASEEDAGLFDAPVERIMQGLDAVKSALDELDAYSVRRGAVVLAALAEGYGMHTLADMARCFRAAWEEGDLEAAAQIVEEMRVEASRAGKIA
ncbi:MAG: hypothetical protein IJD65_02885 [Mailhella sp.]|nr:hypothetical protein [Mailhella sp.]